MEKIKKDYLKIGDKVKWKGAWGAEPSKLVKITDIDICEIGEKNGRTVQKVLWDKVDSRKVVVSLDNGHWAYGFQLSKV